MAEKVKVHLGEGYQIRETGVFNLEKLHSEMKSYLNSMGYDLLKNSHAHKQLDKGDEILITWEAEREVTDYIKFLMKVDFMFREINPASDKLVHGIAKITIAGWLVLDYKNRWSTSKVKDFLHKVHRKTTYKDKINEYSDRLNQEMKALLDTAKEVLDFYR